MSNLSETETQKKLIAVEDNHPPKDNVLRIEWNLGKACNFDCSYCSPSIHAKKADHIDLAIVRRTAKKFVGHAKATSRSIRISLTGGEPYLHPQFMEILRTLKDEGVDRISITTNGSIPTKIYLESLNYIDYLIISVHFEFIRIEKLKQRVLEIQQSLRKNQKLHLHIMLLPGKVQEALKLTAELKKLDISYVLRRIRPQFDENGLFLKPFNSGQKGQHRANWDEIKSQGLSYYATSELEMMGV